jgi:hypothetical protein
MQTKIPIHYILAGCLCMLLSCTSPAGLTGNNEPPEVGNVHFTQEDNIVTVYYDLISSSDQSRFNVQLFIELEDGQSFELNAGSVSGDIGEEVAPGRQKSIQWDVLEDFPQGLEREQIQFAINVQRQRQAGINRNLIYMTTGALVLGAGVSAAILLTNGGNGHSSPLPGPPSRPGS